MTTHSRVRFILLAGVAAVVVTGCSSMPSPRGLFGYSGEPDLSVSPRATGGKWLLIENPRVGEVASEPAYVWVAEDKVPTTMKSLVFGKSSLLAPPTSSPSTARRRVAGASARGRARPSGWRTWCRRLLPARRVRWLPCLAARALTRRAE